MFSGWTPRNVLQVEKTLIVKKDVVGKGFVKTKHRWSGLPVTYEGQNAGKSTLSNSYFHGELLIT